MSTSPRPQPVRLGPLAAAALAAGIATASAATIGLEAAFAQGTAPPSPQSVVARGIAAMGGTEALRSLASTAAEFHTASFALGQSETPESPPRATLAYGRVATDWRGGRRTVSQEVRLLTGQVLSQRRVTVGGVGMLETDGRQAPDAPLSVAGIGRAMRLTPERLLLSALDNPAATAALPSRDWRGYPHDAFRYAAGPDTIALYFDRASGLLTVAETVTDDPILGDRRTATWYTRWQAAGSVKLPRQVDVEVNGRIQSHTVTTALTVNAAPDPGLFAIPDSIAARAGRAPATPAPIAVQLAQLSPGVWRAEGGSHHSLVVEQERQLVVVEAPQSSARAQAVLDTLRSRFPQKPVGLVVNTHHHWDHAGGLRPVIAAGIPIATHSRNAAFIRQIAAAPKTVAPDELSRRRRAPVLRLLEDSLVIGEGDTQVVVYAVATIHSEGLVAAYVPAARLLFTSDVLTPGPTLAPVGSAELVRLARSRGLTVERFAGGHGGVASWAEVERASGL